MIGLRAPRTEFSTDAFQRPVSPVRPEMGYHPLNKTAHTDWDQMFFPLRGCHFSKLVPRGCLGA